MESNSSPAHHSKSLFLARYATRFAYLTNSKYYHNYTEDMETTITSTTELPEETTTDHPRDTTSTTPTSEMSTIPQTTAGTESTEHDLPFYDIE